MKYIIHPEVLPAVARKFREIVPKNLDKDGATVWHMATKIVRLHCIADSLSLRNEVLYGKTY